MKPGQQGCSFASRGLLRSYKNPAGMFGTSFTGEWLTNE